MAGRARLTRCVIRMERGATPVPSVDADLASGLMHTATYDLER
ncbi:hypothetical protein SJI00_05845 [Pseudomonas sp. RP23018S]|nr:hypothetical protein [Pseudomonas sp. RP23018S]MDZ5602288.1 hypothetical protein [Pseudomonas sp. RP23018S]